MSTSRTTTSICAERPPAVALVAGLTVDAYFWHRRSAARRAAAPADIVVAAPSPSPSPSAAPTPPSPSPAPPPVAPGT